VFEHELRATTSRTMRRSSLASSGSNLIGNTTTYASDGKTATMVRARVGQWQYRYDDDGRVLHEEGGPASGDDMDQLAIDYTYDARHRLVSAIELEPSEIAWLLARSRASSSATGRAASRCSW
jgi:hypothetical protein